MYVLNICKWLNDKGLVSKIYKQLTWLNTIKTNTTVKKWEEDLNRHFSKEDVQIAKKHMKRRSKSLIFREMQIKTTMRCHLTPARMATIKKSTNNECWGGRGERRTLRCCWWECSWYSRGGGQCGASLENESWSSWAAQHCHPRACSRRDVRVCTRPNMHCSPACRSQDAEAA